MKREIIKKTSKYNKNMKWHLVEITRDGGKISSWYKTKKEAVYAMDRAKQIKNKYTAARPDS